MTLRVNGETRQMSHSGRMSVTIPEILSHYSPLGYSRRRRALDRHRVRRRRLQPRRRVALPQARRRDRGRDRADRRAPQPGHLVAGGARRARCRRAFAGDELAARRREARARPRADGGGGARRARRARARQRPLPDELLGHEGLRRLRVPARGRADADLPRGLGRGRGAHGLDRTTSATSAATTRPTRARRSPGRSRRRSRRREATAASGSSSRSARRPPTGWSASRRRSRRPGSTPGRPRPTRRRCSLGARDQDAAGDRADALANEIAAAAMEHVRAPAASRG